MSDEKLSDIANVEVGDVITRDGEKFKIIGFDNSDYSVSIERLEKSDSPFIKNEFSWGVEQLDDCDGVKLHNRDRWQIPDVSDRGPNDFAV